MQNLTLPPAPTNENRELHSIRRGLLDGCSIYLSKKERFPVRSGFYERELRSPFATLAADCRIFVDVEAGRGFLSAYVLRHTRARVFAFESNPELGGILLRNLGCNTEDPGRVRFYGETDPSDITLDRLIGAEEGPVLLKIDVPRGAEFTILAGAEALLDREDTRVVMRLSDHASEVRAMGVLDEHGFNVSLVAPAWWRPVVPDAFFAAESVWLVAEKAPFEILAD